MVKLLAVQNNCLARVDDASAPPVLSQGDNANSNPLTSLCISRMSLVGGKSLGTGLSLHFASRTGKLWALLVIADESGAVATQPTSRQQVHHYLVLLLDFSRLGTPVQQQESATPESD